MAGDRQTMHDGDGAPSGFPAGEPLARGAASLLRSNRRPLIVAVCLWVFLVLLNRVLAGEIMAFDRAAIALMVDHVRTAWLTPVMKAVSFVVTPVPLVALIFAIGIGSRARGHRGMGVFCAVNLIGSTVLNQVLKFAIQRPRPDVALRLVDIGGFSFPSGHSMAAMAFFGLLAWLTWRYVDDPRRRAVLCSLLCIMIAAVGFSRVYLGVHYASDVVGGFCASIIWLVVYTKVAGPRLTARSGAPAAA